MENNGSYIRWQNYSVNQLGFTSNLLFTLNIAIIGFLINKIIDDAFILSCSEKAIFTPGFLILFLSLVLGLALNITRLYDFRLTARIARKREGNKNDHGLTKLRECTKNLGNATWTIFIIQLIGFFVGFVLIFLSFISRYSTKIF